MDAYRRVQNSAERTELQDACRFALGKASLMLGNNEKAAEYFSLVIERNNPYRLKARRILSTLSQ
jgi:hypothetical protein